MTPAPMNAKSADTLKGLTEQGPVLVRSHVSPEEIRALSFCMGTKDFARYRPLISDRESLIRAASARDTNVTLAIEEGKRIVGAGILEPPRGEDRWSRLGKDVMMEVSIIEMGRPWRGRKLAEHILRLLADHPARESRILYMVGYSWTWDLDGSGLTAMAYRDMLIRLFTGEGFRIFQTNDPNVTLRPENLFMARVGADVPEAVQKRFKWARFGLDPNPADR